MRVIHSTSASPPSAPADAPQPYRGRFAPTPSGPLHLGSLLTALASWLQARRHHGQWLLRIDDLDSARCPAGTDQLILRQLEAHGLVWDGAPLYQGRRLDRYRAALAPLSTELYACRCTRKELKQRLQNNGEDPVYDGHCRFRNIARDGHALRLAVPAQRIEIEDAWQGRLSRRLETEIGDFVLVRADGVAGYQLASVVDDHDTGITEVVRGADLIPSSLRQHHLFARLGWQPPRFRHLPVLVEDDGRKLSKQNHAQPLRSEDAPRNLYRCLAWLGHAPPVALEHAATGEVLAWAKANWDPSRVPGAPTLTIGAPRPNLA
jgi:glutamyl-Q tRNA(Asp) synthetase